jgi:hypothetical protein
MGDAGKLSIVKLGGGHHARKDDHRGIAAGSDHHVGRNAPTGLGAMHEKSARCEKESRDLPFQSGAELRVVNRPEWNRNRDQEGELQRLFTRAG